jgi:hypothetical protein
MGVPYQCERYNFLRRSRSQLKNRGIIMRFASLLGACLLVAASCAAQVTIDIAPDAASKDDVKKLFDVMASREQMQDMMHQMFTQMRSISREQMKKRQPDVSDEELARMDRESEDLIRHFPLDSMLDDMIPVYQRHFTKSDIDALTTFYSSPPGQKFLHEMPAVTAEAMKAVYPKIQAEVENAIRRAEQNEAPPKAPTSKD